MKRNRILMLSLIAVVAVFLIIDQFGSILEQWFVNWVYRLQLAIAGMSDTLVTNQGSPVSPINFKFSTLLIWVFIFLVGFYILGEIRFSLHKSKRWISDSCPRCGSTIHRIHRNRLDHFINWLLMPHAHRYRCSNTECHWSGLLYGRPRMQSMGGESIQPS